MLVLHCYWVLLPLWSENHTAPWSISWWHHCEPGGQAAACSPAHVLQWNICSLSGELYMNSRLQICGFTTTGDAGANLQAKELWSWVCFCGESTQLFLGSCPHILGTDMSKTRHIWWHFSPQGFTKKASNALGGSISQTQGFTGGKEWREWQTGTNPSDGVHFIHMSSTHYLCIFTLKQKIK